MSHAPTFIDEKQTKEAFKQAIFEVLQERKDWLYDLFAEVMEDMALANAIREGMVGEPATREDVFDILESEA
jgi:hypothetical protein